MGHLSEKSADRRKQLKWCVIRIAEAFAIFVTFAVHNEWAQCWCKTQEVGHARNKSLNGVQ